MLDAAAAEAFTGALGAVFLAGEAGIGKSRLLAEAIERAGGATILLGRCLDERGMPPYLPWIDAFAAPSSFPSAVAQTDLAALRSLLWQPEEAGDAAGASLSPEQRKLRLFDAVVRGLERLAGDRPVLLAFDDLQWSDAASNELLRYLLVHVGPVPLLVLGTYRSEEAAANAELGRTVAELHRRRLLTTIPLGPLAPAETERLLAPLLGQDDPELVAAIHAHSEGNPFFAEEVARALVAEHGKVTGAPRLNELPLPQGVAAVIERRLDNVGAACRDVLQVAALAGRQISVDLVAAVAELAPAEVAALLVEAASAALVRVVAPDALGGETAPAVDFEFLHDRTRETVAASVDPVRRRAVHGRIAAVLEREGRRGGADEMSRLAALTHHARLARQPDRAAAFAARLGDAAMRAHAHVEAAAAYRIAVELAPRSGPAVETMPPLPELRLRLGEAALAAGEADAIDALAAAETGFAAMGDRQGVAGARRRLGTAWARREAFDLAVPYLEGALTILSDLRSAALDTATGAALDAEMAEVLIELGSIQGLSLGRYDDAVAAGERALALLGGGNNRAPGLTARAQLALSNTLMRAGRLGEGHALLAPALTGALGGDDPNLAAEVAGAMATHAYWVGDLDASERAARHRHDLALRGGDPYALRHALSWLAFMAAARGDWSRAEWLLAEAEPHVARLESPEPRAFLRQIAGFVRLQQGRYGEAVDLLEEAVAGFRGSGSGTLVWYLACLATAYLAAGERAACDRTAAEVTALIEGLPVGSLPRAPALTELGLVAALTSDHAAAAHRYDALRPYTGQHHWALVDRVLGMLAATLGDEAAAERHFDAATAAATRGGMRPELALILAERGMARRRSRQAATRATAEPLLREALDLVRSLEMRGEAERVAACLAEGLQTADALPAGLSAREVEVLALVARGLTNREIGARLGISEKTVTNHLTHIFTKANLENRAGAVAFALRHGLA